MSDEVDFRTTADRLFATVRQYADLSAEAEHDWTQVLRLKRYRKDEHFIRAGDTPHSFAFVVQGLFYQHYIGPNGDLIIKYFFPENRIAASVSATLKSAPSLFTITAIEESVVLEYEFADFRSLVDRHRDVAAFYIQYLEQHWVVEKEPGEIAFRHDDAMQRYRAFIEAEPALHRRLKQHHVAAWLGITPESLSRLRRAIAYGPKGRG